METIDCLFVSPSLDLRNSNNYIQIPLGIVGISDFLEKNGFSSKILSVGLEKKLNKKFSIVKFIKNKEIKVVAINLHWYIHSVDALRIARIIKNVTGAKVILGGHTASFFHKEILEKFPFVDGIIKGDAEKPLLVLMKKIKKKDYKNVPNFSYRKSKHIIKSNKISYIASKENLNNFHFSNIEKIIHWKEYVKYSVRSPHDYYVDTRKTIKNIWYVFIGRGCSLNCSYCGGSKIAFEKIYRRHKPSFRNMKCVLEDMNLLYQKGIKNFYISFDTKPIEYDYYTKLLKNIRKEGLDIGLNFSCWRIPSKKFLQEFSKSLNLDVSSIKLTPESGSENIRKINKGLFYTNETLIKTVKNIKEKNINLTLYYTVGLPKENIKDVRATIKLAKYLRNTYKVINKINIVPLEPSSPMYIHPYFFGVKIFRKNFIDFYNYIKELKVTSVEHPLGYETEIFKEKEIIELKKIVNRMFLSQYDIFKNMINYKVVKLLINKRGETIVL